MPRITRAPTLQPGIYFVYIYIREARSCPYYVVHSVAAVFGASRNPRLLAGGMECHGRRLGCAFTEATAVGGATFSFFFLF